MAVDGLCDCKLRYCHDAADGVAESGVSEEVKPDG